MKPTLPTFVSVLLNPRLLGIARPHSGRWDPWAETSEKPILLYLTEPPTTPVSRGWPAAGFCGAGLPQACCCVGWLHDAWAQMSHSTPLAVNKSPLSAHCDCFSLDGSYEAISRKQESALSPSAYWTSLALFSLWGLIRRQHNLPIDCCPPFQPQVPESPGLDSDFACL